MLTDRHTASRTSETLLALRHLCHSLLGDDTGHGACGARSRDDLSKRQWMILEMLAKGLTDDRIAHNLDLSERTVRAEVGAIRERFAATSRFQLGMRFAEIAEIVESSPGVQPPWSCPLQRRGSRSALAPSG